ncbi:MAG: TonB-dependent receptor [Marinoscillum sp.]
MRNTFLLLTICFFGFTKVQAYSISGTVTDQGGEGLFGANVYLKDTYDGTTTDIDGQFQFSTEEQGEQILIVSFIGFEAIEQNITINDHSEVTIQLKEAFNTIDAVTISAGTFEASDKRKVVVLQSLDIATTAGATADITGALNTLPGTQTVGESGRLFVRGGTAEETRIYIDGAEASNYYGASTSGIPTRSRFSPFLFKGTFFSTGGYSAEYGQALSSALILNTLDVDPKSKVNLSIMSVGLEASATKSWSERSLYGKIGYINLNPYNNLIDQRVNWIDGSVSWDGTLAYKHKLDNGGMFKVLAMGNQSSFRLQQETILNDKGYNDVAMKNQNGFVTTNLNVPVGEKDNFYLGTSASYNFDDQQFDSFGFESPTFNYHLKTKFIHEFNPKQVLNSGAEVFVVHAQRDLIDSVGRFSQEYTNVNTAVYSELDQYLSESLVLRGGVRLSHQSLLNELKVEPRLSMAYKLNEASQISFASGLYYQNPNQDYLLTTDDLNQESAVHYILNYQRAKDQKVFRIETFLKDYDELVTYNNLYDATGFANSGDGYAYGWDVFWRDRGGIKNLDYWVSYSWMKSERIFRDFPEKSTPNFSSAHNFSFVLKRFFTSLKSQMGVTYSFTSGRPYENPNLDGFNESMTRAYHDLSYNIAYLPTANVIIYASATNLLGSDQVFGYRYASSPNERGVLDSEAIRLPAKRFLFIGCFITIGAFNNQLDNL